MINTEWIINRLGKKIYPVSHAKSIIRGSSTVDKDMSSMESDIEGLQRYIKNVGVLANEDEVRELALRIIKDKHGSDISIEDLTIDDINKYLSGVRVATDEEVSDISNQVTGILDD